MVMEEIKWKRMMFKGCKVYAQVDEDGALLAQEGNKVGIRYQLDQNMQYWASASSVKEIDENQLKKAKSERDKKRKTPEKQPSPSPLMETKDPNAIIVFTDGACEGNPGPAGIGIVLQYRDQKKEISRFIGPGTNNIAELTAIKIALQEIKSPHLPIILYTDSAYSAKTLDGSWKAKKNQKLIEETKKEMVRFSNLTIIKIKGHAGIEENETADQLARQAIKKRG